MLYPFLLTLFCCFFTISWYKIWNGAVVCDCLGGETPLTIMAIVDTSLLVILLSTRKQYRVEIDFANAHSKFSEIRAAGFVLLTMVLLPLVAKTSIQEVSGVLIGAVYLHDNQKGTRNSKRRMRWRRSLRLQEQRQWGCSRLCL